LVALQGGGGIVHQLKKSYSLTDLANVDDADFGAEAAGGGGGGGGNDSISRAIGFFAPAAEQQPTSCKQMMLLSFRFRL
jgi:hypothetical protein